MKEDTQRLQRWLHVTKTTHFVQYHHQTLHYTKERTWPLQYLIYHQFPGSSEGVRDREEGQNNDRNLVSVAKEAETVKTQGDMNFSEGQITAKLEKVLERLMRSQQNTQQQTTTTTTLAYVDVEDDTLFHKLHTQVHHHITNTKKGQSKS